MKGAEGQFGGHPRLIFHGERSGNQMSGFEKFSKSQLYGLVRSQFRSELAFLETMHF